MLNDIMFAGKDELHSTFMYSCIVLPEPPVLAPTIHQSKHVNSDASIAAVVYMDTLVKSKYIGSLLLHVHDEQFFI